MSMRIVRQAFTEISVLQREILPAEVTLSGEPSRPEIASSRKRTYNYILVLGPSGSGKSSLINAVSNEQMAVALPGSGLYTTSFRNAKVTVRDKRFKLIDSPGFNTTSLSSHDIIKSLVLHLLNLYYGNDIKLTGILYLHPADSDLGSHELKQNLIALKILLGDSWLSCVTIAVVPGPTNKETNDKVIDSIQDHTSPFYEFCLGGARVCNLSLQIRNIQQLLLEYNLQPPQMPYFYTQFKSTSPRELKAYIEEQLHLPQKVIPNLQPQQHRSAGRDQCHSLVSATDRSSGGLQQLNLALAEAKKEKDSLHDQLEQTRSEYTSLRSELQLRDNTEQLMIVQSLKNLNRRIESFGRLAAAYLVDNHIGAHLTDVTTLQAANIAELKDQFSHSGNGSSLVVSMTGQGIPIEDFTDFALRSIVCQRLCENIFTPFYPSLSSNINNEFMLNLYNEVRAQEHPTVAAQWRASSFSAISKRTGSETRTRAINQYVEQITTQHLDRLFKGVFGQEAQVTLPEQHYGCLREIVTLAWDWNQVLKGTIVLLGDFQPVTCANGSAFDPLGMEEFEVVKKNNLSSGVVLFTTGLGLILSRSKVKGSVPVEEVVCRATVVTEQRYK